MKVPQLFKPERDLTDKINDYLEIDNLEPVKAVTDVKLKSDLAKSGSLVGALANRANERHQQFYDRMVDTMLNKLGYHKTSQKKQSNTFVATEGNKT